MIVRIGIVIVVMAVLWVLGAIDPEALPWQEQDFQVTGLTLLVFIAWSSIESRQCGSLCASLASVVFTSVLLISAVDSFLLEFTVITEPFLLRWIGLGVFTLGIVLRVYSILKGYVVYYKVGRILVLLGLPVAFGSLFGLVLAAVAGVPTAFKEEFPRDCKVEPIE